MENGPIKITDSIRSSRPLSPPFGGSHSGHVAAPLPPREPTEPEEQVRLSEGAFLEAKSGLARPKSAPVAGTLAVQASRTAVGSALPIAGPQALAVMASGAGGQGLAEADLPVALPAVSAVQVDRSAPAQVQSFQEQVLRSLPGATQEEVRLGSLFLWEKSLDKACTLPQMGGQLTAYLSSLRVCLGVTSGPMSAAIGQALHSLAPESGFAVRQGNTYLSGLPNHRVFAVAGAIGGTKELSGVHCAGLWNEAETAKLGSALSKLEAAYPRFREKLSSIVVQTWIGDGDPSLGRNDIGGNVDSQSPGMFRLNRSSLKNESLEHFLFHEFGHLIDITNDDPENFEFASHKTSAFIGRDKAIQCVSPYARTAIHEDYAETFAFCVQHREKMLANSDLYFHAMGPLSEKFRHIFTERFGREIPPPGPRFEAFRAALREGRTPFGVWGAKGKVEGAVQHSRWAIKELMVGSLQSDPDKRIERESSPEVKKQLEFIKEYFLEGKDVQASPPTAGQMESKLLEFSQLQPRMDNVRLRLKENEEACNTYSDPSEVPSHRTSYAGLRFGQKAMSLRDSLEALEGRPPQTWRAFLEKNVKDPTLHRNLERCQDFAAIKQAVLDRQDQLMEFFSALGQREKDENVPQERELLHAERNALSARFEALKSELSCLISTAQNDFRKNLVDPQAQEPYYKLLHQG